jgi:hypothetical protein
MPVSTTRKATTCPSAINSALIRTSPRSVNLSELEMKLRRICGHLRLVGVEHERRVRFVEYQCHGFVDEQWAQHAAERAEQMPDVELDRPHNRLAGLHLGEVQQVAHQLRDASAAWRMNTTWRSCSLVKSPSLRSSSMRTSA